MGMKGKRLRHRKMEAAEEKSNTESLSREAGRAAKKKKKVDHHRDDGETRNGMKGTEKYQEVVDVPLTHVNFQTIEHCAVFRFGSSLTRFQTNQTAR